MDTAEVKVDDIDSLTGETALTISAAQGRVDVISVLLLRGANVSVANKKENSPIILAVKEGHWVVVELLLQHHARIEQTDAAGRTPLMVAAAEGHVALTEMLIDKGKPKKMSSCFGCCFIVLKILTFLH